MLKVVFMGTPDFAVPSLRALYEDSQIDLVGVVTQPDRINRRGKKSIFSPVKKFAEENGLPLLQPQKLSEETFRQSLVAMQPDLIVVVAYGKILPAYILNMPQFGCVNVHASLLPKYRGAAPIQRSIMDGCKRTGVSIMKLDEGMDTGAVLGYEEVEIGRYTDTDELTVKLSVKGAEALLKMVHGLPDILAEAHEQNPMEATYADKIEKPLGKINWAQSADTIHRLVNALHTNPGVYTIFRGKRLKIHRTDFALSEISDAPGMVISLNEKGIGVGTGKGVLYLQMVQPESKREMPATDFINGHQVKKGEKFDTDSN